MHRYPLTLKWTNKPTIPSIEKLMTARVDSIVKKLETRGVKPIKIDSSGLIPAIWITEVIYIQVGSNYVVVCNIKNNTLSTYFATMHISDIMSSLKQAINQ